jgi:cytochrome c-type biogenesis protein
MLAASSATVGKGILMLLLFSLGLGIPFVVSALLIERLKIAFDFIKRHYRAVNIISGSLLVLIGLLMMYGLLNSLLGLLSF